MHVLTRFWKSPRNISWRSAATFPLDGTWAYDSTPAEQGFPDPVTRSQGHRTSLTFRQVGKVCGGGISYGKCAITYKLGISLKSMSTYSILYLKETHLVCVEVWRRRIYYIEIHCFDAFTSDSHPPWMVESRSKSEQMPVAACLLTFRCAQPMRM